MIKQNARNQEAGEHKEEIDSAPGETRSAEAIEDDALGLDDLAVEVMVNEHEENRDSPHTVELRYSLQDARGGLTQPTISESEWRARGGRYKRQPTADGMGNEAIEAARLNDMAIQAEPMTLS